ncbi:MAG TPA: hypothetical protein VK570_16545 [Rubrivivax sp.]|jgi:hypothetical protein|nr:hypothetical protein [Rubrivivax sp.]
MPESLTDDPRPRGLTQRVGGLFAALGVVGALMVALPLAQLLRYQVSEASALSTAQSQLDPMAHAVGVQRALLAHRDAAALVLAGHARFEPERQIRQRAVDQGLSALVGALASGLWPLAVNEAETLGQDWRSLARSCASRSVAVSQSHQAHGLLIEQTLQVMDMVTGGAVPDSPGLQHQPPTLAVVHALPRLAWKQAQVRESELATQAGSTAHSVQKSAAGEGALLALTTQRAAGAALDAQLALYQQAYSEGARHLAAQRRALQSDSGGLVIAMLALAGVAMLLTRAAWPGLRQLAADLQSAPPSSPAPSGLHPSRPQDQAGVLLDRLRDGRPGHRPGDRTDDEPSPSDDHGARPTDRTKRDPQTTLPPPP